jgi:signal transduction histidine kinase
VADGGEARAAAARLAIMSATVLALSATLFIVATVLLLGPFAGLSEWPGDGRAASWLRASPNGFPTRSSAANPRRDLWRQPLGATEGQQLSQIFRFRRDPGDRPALLLPVIDGEFAVFVNGVRAPGEGRAAPPYLALSGARAWLWPIPLDLIRPGDNRIDLVIGPARGRVLRAPLYVGPVDRLEPVVSAIARLEILARPGLAVLGLVAAGLALLAGAARWTARPWIALAAAAAAVGARTLISAPDVAAGLGPAWRPTDLALLAALLVCTGLAARGSGGADWRSARFAAAVSAASLLAGVVAASSLAWGVWTLAAEALYVAGAVALLLALSAVSALTAGPALWRRMVQWIDLGRTVRRQRAEIQAASAALQQEMRRSAILEERQRLARDMHDGIGGQLVSLLARVRTRRISLDQMEAELVGGLSELRLLVDSLDAVGESLSGALAAFRARIRPQAEAAGMTLIWAGPDDLDIEASDPRWILNLYRLLQEAVTNAVRHAGGETLAIRVERRGPRGLTIVVEDDGSGFDPATIERGKGLANMEVRAAQLGADLRWTVPGSGLGTAVKIELVVPDRPPPTSPAR